MKYDVIVIGGGAAGLYAAMIAGRRTRKTLVIEHNGEVGRKILISGGGRCNFTNVDTRPENFISENPHFAKSAFARHTPDDFLRLVRKHKIEYYEKKLGQLFCRGGSRQIVEMLVAECRFAGVQIETSAAVESVERKSRFEIKTNRGHFCSDSLIIATGGLSFTKIGATDFGYRVARQFGIPVVATRPSLVPLKAAAAWPQLAGVSIDARVLTNGADFRESILFTHRGMSGPAILQISNYWQPAMPVNINFLPTTNAFDFLIENRHNRKLITNFLGAVMPERLAKQLFCGIDKPLDQCSNADLREIAQTLNDFELKFSGTEGYDRAEVTLGGVSTSELSSQTMESKKVAGLYFIGEVVDVTGWLGGYNFQWAWSSAFAAGNSA